MKKIIRVLIMVAGVSAAVLAQAQNKIDEDRMNRDISVAENVLSTLIRQQFNRPSFFPMEVTGTYLPGFGVTFHIPTELAGQMLLMMNDQPGYVYSTAPDGSISVTASGYSKSYRNIDENGTVDENDCEDCPRKVQTRTKNMSVAPRATKKNMNDSIRLSYNAALIQASKDFIADYGDLISQLSAGERIVITNKMDRSGNNWFWRNSSGASDLYLSMEALKSDLTSYKQGKINRQQFLEKIKTISTETTEDLSPDLELLSSIFNRLYRPDLSKTYFIQEDVYYDRLKDYGVIYEMHVYSSTGTGFGQYDLPTVGMRDVKKEDRYKKVKELYPAFEKSLLDDVLEYGKTLKSLKDDEMLVFNVRLTECKGCGIPASIEITFKNSVLKEYSSGKLSKDAALGKVAVKKGPIQ